MKTALIIIFLVISVILAVIVMMQEGKGGLSGAISGGGADTYWSKNKGKSKESVLKKVTVVLGVLYLHWLWSCHQNSFRFTSCFDKKQLIFWEVLRYGRKKRTRKTEVI